MIATFSWIALCTAATIIAAQLLLALPAYFINTYIPQPWHYFVVYQAINIVVLVYNLFVLKRTPWVHNIGCKSLIHLGCARILTAAVALTLVTFLLTVVVCLALSTKQPSSYVWTQLQNSTGWSDGVCFLTGLATPCFMYAGIDASLHLAEECTNPKKTVPRALFSTVIIGFVTALVFSISMCYSIVDLDAMLDTT